MGGALTSMTPGLGLRRLPPSPSGIAPRHGRGNPPPSTGGGVEFRALSQLDLFLVLIARTKYLVIKYRNNVDDPSDLHQAPRVVVHRESVELPRLHLQPSKKGAREGTGGLRIETPGPQALEQKVPLTAWRLASMPRTACVSIARI